MTGDKFADNVLPYSADLVKYIPLALKEFADGNDDLLLTWVNLFYSEDKYGTVNDFYNSAIFCYDFKPTSYEQSLWEWQENIHI
ncbi:MAG: hypothetical protein R2809_11165 [Flavobacteriales bacterium]